MSVWDYIYTHRLLINKSLRKEAEGLRARIDAYQIEYDRRIEECQEELNKVEKEYQESILQFRDSLVEELQGERSLVESIAQDITSYADNYLYRNRLLQMRDIKRKELEILQEDNAFLSQQMDLIGKEIDYLRDRQNELTAFTDVKDIIRLTTLSSYEISFDEKDDAKDLLDKVSQAIYNCEPGQDNTERFSLECLKGIIQERSEYLPTIKYIAWVIQQKIQFSKQISDKRDGVRDSKATVRQEIKQIEDNISLKTRMLEDIAKRVRYYWAKPITYLNADISYAYLKLKKDKETSRNVIPGLKSERKRLIEKRQSAISDMRDKKSRRASVGSELKSMSDSHSSDQWRWNNLQSERKGLTSEIDDLSSRIYYYSARIDSINDNIKSLESVEKDSEILISAKKKERQKWNENKAQIINMLKRYGIGFRSNRQVAEKDEMEIISTRLEEIKKIREAGVVEAQKIYKQECEKIIRLHEEKVSAYEEQRQELNKEHLDAEASCTKCEKRTASAKKRVQSSKDADNRFFLFKLFSESAATTMANEELEKAHAALAKAQETKKSVELMIDKLEHESVSEAKVFDEEMKKCKPRYLRPTAAEQEEENKLLLRREEMNKQREESGYENENKN